MTHFIWWGTTPTPAVCRLSLAAVCSCLKPSVTSHGEHVCYSWQTCTEPTWTPTLSLRLKDDGGRKKTLLLSQQNVLVSVLLQCTTVLMDWFSCCINMRVAVSCCRLELSSFQPQPHESIRWCGSVLWLSCENHTDLNKAEKHTGC